MPTPPPTKVTAETIAQMSAELVGVPIKEKERPAVAELLNSLAADMASFRAMDVKTAEPALIYDAGEENS